MAERAKPIPKISTMRVFTFPKFTLRGDALFIFFNQKPLLLRSGSGFVII